MIDLDLIDAVQAAHVFTSSSRSRGGGRIENVAACTCGHPFDWQGRDEQHRRHVLVEIAQAVRAQVAAELRAHRYVHAAWLVQQGGAS